MFIFFFNLATFILKKNHDYILSTKNHGQRLVKATALTSVSIQGTVQAGEEVTAILKPDDANNDDSGITYSWEIYSEEQPGASSSEEQPGASSSEEQPGASSSEEQPGASSSEEQPEASSSEEQPEASSSEEQPGASSSEEQPGASSSEEQPGASSSEEQPGASSSDEQPGASSSEEQPGASSSEEQPGASSSEEQPGASSSEEQPGASSSEEQPEASSSEEQPGASSSEEQPEASSSEEQPGASSSEEQPGASSSEEQSEASSSEEQPGASSSEEQPGASSSEEQPGASSSEEQSEASSSDEQPGASSSEEQPGASSSEEQPGASSSEEQPGASSSEEQPEASSSEEQPGASSSEEQPGASSSEEQPGASSSEEQPEASSSEEQPGASSSEEQPGASSSEEQPGASSSEEQPEASSSEEQPGASSSEEQPGASSSEEQPGASSSEEQPGASSSEEQPGASSSEEQPGASSSEEQPGASSSEEQPGASSSEEQPGASSSEEQPGASSSEEQPGASSSEEQPEASSSDEQPGASSSEEQSEASSSEEQPGASSSEEQSEASSSEEQSEASSSEEQSEASSSEEQSEASSSEEQSEASSSEEQSEASSSEEQSEASSSEEQSEASSSEEQSEASSSEEQSEASSSEEQSEASSSEEQSEASSSEEQSEASSSEEQSEASSSEEQSEASSSEEQSEASSSEEQSEASSSEEQSEASSSEEQSEASSSEEQSEASSSEEQSEASSSEEQSEASSSEEQSEASSSEEQSEASSSEEQSEASSSEEPQPAKLLEDGWKVICTTKICKIPDDTPVGSKIRVKASGNGSKYTGDVTSEELLIETGSQDESSSEPIVEVSSSEEQGEASSSFEPPAEVTTSEEAIKPDACINNSNLHCNACDQSNPYICVSCKTGYIFNDKKVCIPLSDIKDCKDIPFCLSCADDISKCAECETGYHVSGGICELNDNNCSNVVTNCKHCENNPKFCNQCEDNYGLSNGVCTLCPTGLFVDNKSPCKPDCSIIPNCAICERYKGMIVCTYCNENYTVNEDGSSCVSVKDLPLDYCKNSYKDNGCVECNSENPTRCKTCNTGWTFLEDGFCTCHDGYVNNGRCYNETETACPAEITNCKYCLNEKCVECNSKYMLNNGQCTLIECNIEHCSECSTDDNNQVICAICERDYIRSVDKKRCVIEEFINCSSIPGCTKCSNVTNKCVECDTSNGYEKEPIKDYDDDVFCSCDQYHELYEGKCFLPILPLEPDPEPPRIEINSSMYEFNQEEGLVQITGSSENKTAIYEMQVSSEFKNIVVPDNITDITFNVRGDRTEDKPLIINSTESTEVTLKFIGDSAVKIPQDSSNIDIKGNGKIILMPFTEEGSSETPQQMTINKVVPTQGDEIEFDPRVDNLILNEIQTFGESKLIGSTDPEKKVTCKNLLIESGGSFTTDNIIFEKVKIGLKSALHLTSNNTKFAEGSNIYLFYNRTLTERHFPLTINRAYPDFSKSNVLVYQYEANKKLPVDLESEQLLVAQFVNDEQKKEDTYQQCLDLKSRFQRKNGFGDPDCVNSTKDNGEVDLIAHRVAEDKDSGSKLSGGAIAGIVIACVVVVAAIIALLVYFLVIKKRNQSTTSTQGDSSIAI